MKVYLLRLLSLCSNEDLNFSGARICRDNQQGNYPHFCPQLTLDKSAFLIDSLEIGKSKYLELRRTLLSDNLKLPGYNRVAVHRAQVNLVDEVRLIHREFSIVVGISYTRQLSHTVNRIVMSLIKDGRGDNIAILIKKIKINFMLYKCSIIDWKCMGTGFFLIHLLKLCKNDLLLTHFIIKNDSFVI